LGPWVWVRLGVVGIVALWFGWFSYVRWTALPAAATQTMAGQTAGDAAEELLELTGRLPPPPTPGSGPSYPWTWNFWERFGTTLCGPWDPASREDLQEIEAYLARPATVGVLNQIVEQCETLRERIATEESKALRRLGGPATWHTYEADVAVAALAVRARQRHASQGDLAGALRDLRAATYLALFRQVCLPLGYAARGSSPDMAELVFLAQEHDLPPRVAADTITLLTDELPFRFSDAVARLSLGSGGVDAFLDRHYTDDGTGNGWLVLSSMDQHPFMVGSAMTTPRSGAWNLLSPIFNDRRTVAGKLTGLEKTLTRLDEQDYGTALASLRVWGLQHVKVNVLDGPVGSMLNTIDLSGLEPVMLDVMWRRAVVVMLALSAYKHDQGTYPETLAELVPRYLSAVPTDLLANKPFVYERHDASGYTLRSARPIKTEHAIVLMYGLGRHAQVNAYSVPRPDLEE
jgi:hypothetical protein